MLVFCPPGVGVTEMKPLLVSRLFLSMYLDAVSPERSNPPSCPGYTHGEFFHPPGCCVWLPHFCLFPHSCSVLEAFHVCIYKIVFTLSLSAVGGQEHPRRELPSQQEAHRSRHSCVMPLLVKQVLHCESTGLPRSRTSTRWKRLRTSGTVELACSLSDDDSRLALLLSPVIQGKRSWLPPRGRGAGDPAPGRTEKEKQPGQEAKQSRGRGPSAALGAERQHTEAGVPGSPAPRTPAVPWAVREEGCWLFTPTTLRKGTSLLEAGKPSFPTLFPGGLQWFPNAPKTIISRKLSGAQ